HQYLPHRLRSRAEKMRAILPFFLLVLTQTQPRLVHQRRRLQRMPRRLSRHPVRRQPAQFVVNQRQQISRRTLLPSPDGIEENGDVAHGLNIRDLVTPCHLWQKCEPSLCTKAPRNTSSCSPFLRVGLLRQTL